VGAPSSISAKQSAKTHTSLNMPAKDIPSGSAHRKKHLAWTLRTTATGLYTLCLSVGAYRDTPGVIWR
ncbi:MAG: hypothetical protein IJQ86_07405, partial [Spirochaetia bacterium]|nr:hypothetical protein [Spirochaetia bacterium]